MFPLKNIWNIVQMERNKDWDSDKYGSVREPTAYTFVDILLSHILPARTSPLYIAPDPVWCYDNHYHWHSCTPLPYQPPAECREQLVVCVIVTMPCLVVCLHC